MSKLKVNELESYSGTTITIDTDTVFNKNVTVSGNLILGDADTDSIDFNADIVSNIIPDATNTYNLGSGTKKWKDLHLSGAASIGTLGVTGNLTVDGVSQFYGRAFFTSESSSDSNNRIYFRKARSSSAGILSNGDHLGNIIFTGADGSAYQDAASINAIVSGTPSSSNVPAKIDFRTSNGTHPGTVRMQILANGNVGIGDHTFTPTAKLGVDGDINLTGSLNFDGSSVTVSSIIDDDTMGTAAATALATSESVKAYVDAQDAAIASDTLTFTNKTFDANGTGNNLSNVEVSDFAASAVVIESEGISSNDNDTTLPTSAAVKDYVDSAITAQDLDFQADSGGALNIDLDSEVLSVVGGSGVTTTGSGNQISIATDAAQGHVTSVGTLTSLNVSGNTAIGVASAEGILHTADNSGVNIFQRSNNSASYGTNFYIRKSRGTVGSEANVGSGDMIGQMSFSAYYGDFDNQSASISSKVEGTLAADTTPGSLIFSTTAAGANTVTERMRIDSSGSIGIGIDAPTQKLHVNTPNDGEGIKAENASTGAAFEAKYISGAGNGYQLKLDDNNNDTTIFLRSYGNSYFNTGGNFGIGTTSPEGILHTANNSGTNIFQRSNNSATYGTNFYIRKSRGTVGSEANVSSGDMIGQMSFSAYYGDYDNQSASISSKVEGTLAADTTPGNLIFSTTAAGANAVTERMRIDSGGNVGIGTDAPHATARLHVHSTTSGFLPPRMTTTQRNAISTPAPGLLIFNTTTNKLECWDGTSWQACF